MNHIVRTALPVALSVWARLAYAQSNTTPNSSRETAGQSTTAQPPATSATEPVMQAIEMNSAEVALAKTAASKAQDSRVKSFADMMAKDHTQALSKLRDFQGATSTDVKPNAKHQATADRLSKLSGAEFDREYMNTMVSDHQEALDFFEKESKPTGTSTSGAGKTSFAKVSQELLPTVRKHLQEAQKLQKDLGNSSDSKTTKPNPPASNRNDTAAPAGANPGNRGNNGNSTDGNANGPGANPGPGAPAGGAAPNR